MEMKIVDLYREFGLEKPEGAVGRLTCWIQTPCGGIHPERQHPAILVLPGGGYAMTSDREHEPIAMAFFARGYSAFALEYSCTPHIFPTALREAVLAMAYIRRHAQAMSVHPNRIAAIGFSAGAHLCGTLGMMYDCPEVADLASGTQARPDALALCYPVAMNHTGSFRNLTGGVQALAQRLALDKLARPDMPPVYLWHTQEDAVVPVSNSLLMALRLDELGVPFAMNIYHRGPHGLSLANELVYPANSIPPHTKSAKHWVDSCVEFFAEQGILIEE